MTTISKTEFEQICSGIAHDKESIIRHNPVGTDNEVLLWMLLSCLNSYLSLSDDEAPCFEGVPDEDTYRNAILFVLKNRADDGFDPGPMIDNLLNNVR